MPTFKEQFDKHAKSIGLKVNEYFASILKEDGKTMYGSFSLDYPDSPTVRFCYHIGNGKSKTGNLNITLDSFLSLGEADIEELTTDISLRTHQYDIFVKQLADVMPSAKKDLKDWFA